MVVVEVGGRRNGRRKTPLWSYDFTTTGPQVMEPQKTDANNVIGRRTTSILHLDSFLNIIRCKSNELVAPPAMTLEQLRTLQ